MQATITQQRVTKAVFIVVEDLQLKSHEDGEELINALLELYGNDMDNLEDEFEDDIDFEFVDEFGDCFELNDDDYENELDAELADADAAIG